MMKTGSSIPVSDLIDVPFEDIQSYRDDPNFDKVFGSIYFIRSFALNRIKIGITTRAVKSRLDELQTGSPTTLMLIGYCSYQNPLAIEQALHRMFGELRVKEGGRTVGEWFHGHHILYNFIWQFADRIGEGRWYPEDILQGKGIKIKQFKPMMEVKKTTYYDEYKGLITPSNVKMLNKVLIRRYQTQVKGKK